MKLSAYRAVGYSQPDFDVPDVQDLEDEMIAVMRATGNTGRKITQVLLGAGEEVRVTRPVENQTRGLQERRSRSADRRRGRWRLSK